MTDITSNYGKTIHIDKAHVGCVSMKLYHPTGAYVGDAILDERNTIRTALALIDALPTEEGDQHTYKPSMRDRRLYAIKGGLNKFIKEWEAEAERERAAEEKKQAVIAFIDKVNTGDQTPEAIYENASESWTKQFDLAEEFFRLRRLYDQGYDVKTYDELEDGCVYESHTGDRITVSTDGYAYVKMALWPLKKVEEEKVEEKPEPSEQMDRVLKALSTPYDSLASAGPYATGLPAYYRGY